jgi:predicted nuclease with TOPRIM domain
MRWLWTWLMALAALVLVDGGLGVCGGGARASAQEQPKYEVLKKMYDDAIGSLKAAQETKSQLAAKNEELTKQVADLQKQLEVVAKDREELARQNAANAEKTFTLRANYAAWQEFLKRYPSLNARWKAFMETDLLKAGQEAPSLMEPGWPFKVEG